jgi:GNAT superfamily N-acetyltransferase
MSHDWTIETLKPRHTRSQFDSGEESLDLYIRQLARSHASKGFSRTYVAVRPPSHHVEGFYSICAGSIQFHDLPIDKAPNLPHYPVPTAHIARLAVTRSAQGQGLGGILLWDALRLAVHIGDQIGIYAATVDALHDKARNFYLHHGFERLQDDPHHLFLMLETVRKAALE